MPIFNKGPYSRRSLTIEKVRRKNEKEIRKQAQWVEIAGLMANRPTKIKRGKEEVNGQGSPMNEVVSS